MIYTKLRTKLCINLFTVISAITTTTLTAMNHNPSYPDLYPQLQQVRQQSVQPLSVQQPAQQPVQQPPALNPALEQFLRTQFEQLRVQQQYSTQQACTTAVNKAFAKVFLGTLGFYLIYKWYTHNNPKKRTNKYYARL